jgi:hypothetical protein
MRERENTNKGRGSNSDNKINGVVNGEKVRQYLHVGLSRGEPVAPLRVVRGVSKVIRPSLVRSPLLNGKYTRNQSPPFFYYGVLCLGVPDGDAAEGGRTRVSVVLELEDHVVKEAGAAPACELDKFAT